MVSKLISGVLCLMGLNLSAQTFNYFDPASSQFEGSKLEQLRLLTSVVKPMGVLELDTTKNPQRASFLDSLMTNDSTDFDLLKNHFGLYLNRYEMELLCGSLDSSISSNSKGTRAKYFVIHDTSFPFYEEEDFPFDIDSSSWNYNDVEATYALKNGKSAVAHAFVGRTGEVFCQLDLSVPWRATKLELQKIESDISKGLFVHIELVQPRRSDSSHWKGNDIISPKPGFTSAQYHQLALLYISACIRAKDWLVPAYHAVLDHQIKGGHDDPQGFEMNSWNDALRNITMELNPSSSAEDFMLPAPEVNGSDSSNIWATWYYVPITESIPGTIPLLDQNEKELGFYLDSCQWCDAVIEGTVIMNTDSGEVVLNYAGRSKNLQYDCRKCPQLENYEGYEKSGKVLFRKSSGYGDGVMNYGLVPFRTIAVDPEEIPFGSTLYIPEARGAQFINSTGDTLTHDGYFFAGDTGSAIQGNHIDVFVGTAANCPFDFVKSRSNKMFKVYWIEDSEIERQLRLLHVKP